MSRRIRLFLFAAAIAAYIVADAAFRFAPGKFRF